MMAVGVSVPIDEWCQNLGSEVNLVNVCELQQVRDSPDFRLWSSETLLAEV